MRNIGAEDVKLDLYDGKDGEHNGIGFVEVHVQ